MKLFLLKCVVVKGNSIYIYSVAEFENEDDMNNAIKKYDGYRIDGQEINVFKNVL